MNTRPYQRTERLAERLKQGVGEILVSGDLADPRLAGAVVTRTWVSGDLRIGRIYLSTFDGMADAERRASLLSGFRSAAGVLRSRLNRSLGLRRSLELEFFWDDELERVRDVDQTLKELADSDPSHADSTVDHSPEEDPA